MHSYVAPLLALLLFAACGPPATNEVVAVAIADSDGTTADGVVATVDGTEITRAAVEKLVRPQLIELENKRMEMEKLESILPPTDDDESRS